MNLSTLLQWLKKPRAPTPSPPARSATVDPAPNAGAHGLTRQDIHDAIAAHLAWRTQFNDWLSQDEPADPASLPGPERCGLGLWLAQAATHRSPGQHLALAGLAREHQRLHACAAQALQHARAGRMGQASTMLNRDFERHHRRVMQLLHSLAAR